MKKELSIYEQIRFCTVRIETIDVNQNPFSGTGFFFNLIVDNMTIPLVCTNKHVVRGMKKGYLLFTEKDAEGSPILGKHFRFDIDSLESQWIMHPNNEVDLCVMPIAPMIDFAAKIGHNLFYISLDNNLIPSQENAEELDAVEDIIMVGYPNGLWDTKNNMPLIRKGITATSYSLDFQGKKEFVIDAACFPGSSGSPVFICNIGSYHDKFGNSYFGKPRVFLLGVLYAGPQLTVSGDIKVVNIPNNVPIVQSVTHIPNNLGYVIKSERLFDFIEPIKKILHK